MCSMFSALTKLSTKAGLLALLLVAAADVAAQAPAYALALSPAGLQAFAQEQEMDLMALNAFEKQRNSRIGKKVRAALARPGTWSLYGRVGPMNFTNQLAAGTDGMQYSLRGNSFGLKGRLYIGVHTRF